MLPFDVTNPATVPQRSEILEGIMNYPVYLINKDMVDESPYDKTITFFLL